MLCQYAHCIFSNGDGLNERFVPLTVDCNISDFSIKIYNRWGNEVFSSNDPFLAWDGTYNKETVSLGVYVWMMEYSIENAAGEITKVEDHGDIMVIK